MFRAREPAGSGVSPPLVSRAGRSDKAQELVPVLGGWGGEEGGLCPGVTCGLGGPPRHCRAMCCWGQGID